MRRRNIFVVGLDEFNRQKLERIPHEHELVIHAALDISDIRGVDHFDMKALLEKAERNIRSVGVPVDAITAYYDFPATDLVPILAEVFGVPGPSLESVLKCEHKYWSRLEHQKSIPEYIPQFHAFDPFAEDPLGDIPLMPPYWIKPIKSFRSFLAFRINDPGDLLAAMPQIREQSAYIADPFAYLFEAFNMPAEIAGMKESFIAESLLYGSMCTVEGYVFDGDVVIYGIVDSVREGDRSSFARYEYPSSLPPDVQFRMADVSRRVVTGIGLNNSPFNIEFFWDQTHNQVGLLEINPRISQAHSDIFEKVHGVSNHAIMVQVALGRKPKALEKNGVFQLAGNFMLRAFADGVVRSVPTEGQLAQVQQEQPHTVVLARVRPGQRLSELNGQDSYSYELANICIGGRDQAELLEKYQRCLEIIEFDIEWDELRVT